MKKMILTVVAVMTVTFGFAKTENTNSVNNNDKYELNIDMRRLAEKLDLTYEQMAAVQTIHDNLNEEMAEAATAHHFERMAIMDKAIRKDVHNMRNVLNDKQYRTYLTLLGATINNNRRMR